MQPDFVEKLVITYEGHNGYHVDLCGGDNMGILCGPQGIALATDSHGTEWDRLFETQVDTIYNSTAFEIGARYGGLKENMFEFTLAFHVHATHDRPWRINDSRFRKAMSYKKDSKLIVQILGESERWLNVRLRGTPKLKVQTDPNNLKYGLLLVNFVAAYPRWQEDDVTLTYTTATNSKLLSAPVASTPTTSTSGGTLAAATYYYKVTALSAYGQTTGSNEVSRATTGSTSRNTLTWSAVTGATGYKVYRSTSSGAEQLLATLGAVTTYNDTGTSTTATSVPSTNTTSGIESDSFLVSNPTDNEIWLKWVLQAGNAGIIWTLPDFSFGDDREDRAEEDEDRMIVMPDLVLNENVVVDTDEMTMAGQVVSSLDTQVHQRMNGREFLYPIPPYTDPTELPFTVTAADIGNVVQVRMPRTWSRPWGLE